MTLQSLSTFRFTDVEVREPELRVMRSGEPLALEPKAFRVLVYLLRHAGHLVTKEELLDAVWGDTAVTENSLTRAVALLRRVLEDDPRQPRFIETVSTAGYRFICPVEVIEDSTEIKAVKGGAWVGAVLRKWRIPIAASGVLIALAATLVGLNVAGWRDKLLAAFSGATGAGLPQIRSLAVLPFDDLSGGQSQEYFADGMTEELITNLASISSIRVISRESVMQFRGSKKPLPEIARELNVDGIVEGTVTRSGNRVRITANLLHAPTDRHLWANSYDSELEDVLVTQDNVARSIADALRIKFASQSSAPFAHPRRVNPEAYDAYLQGMYFLDRWGEAEFEKAAPSFRRSIDLDPTYAPAYAGLAFFYVYRAIPLGTQPAGEALPLAKAAASKAAELDDGLAEAHIAQAFVKFYWDWDWAAAEPEFKRAIELSPNNALAHLHYATCLNMMCRGDEGVIEAQKALELDPLSPGTNFMMGWNYFYTGRFDDAIKQLTKTVTLDPNFGIAYGFLGMSYAMKKMFPQAVQACQKALILNPEEQGTLATCAMAYNRAGKRQDALSLLDRLMKLSKRSYLDPGTVAWLYAGLNDTDNTIAWFERAYREHRGYGVRSEALPDRVRSDPRFQALLRRMNLPIVQACNGVTSWEPK
ncbi:MAG: winged helix-turn-helix domain-containing protein [Terracidiphilus sp.]|jgi:TolB-like protein/DNA-binding winged helix-turn-helix (wHTH) protein/Flp pilus assembly protein TadD